MHKHINIYIHTYRFYFTVVLENDFIAKFCRDRVAKEFKDIGDKYSFKISVRILGLYYLEHTYIYANITHKEFSSNLLINIFFVIRFSRTFRQADENTV